MQTWQNIAVAGLLSIVLSQICPGSHLWQNSCSIFDPRNGTTHARPCVYACLRFLLCVCLSFCLSAYLPTCLSACIIYLSIDAGAYIVRVCLQHPRSFQYTTIIYNPYRPFIAAQSYYFPNLEMWGAPLVMRTVDTQLWNKDDSLPFSFAKRLKLVKGSWAQSSLDALVHFSVGCWNR